MSKSFEMNQNLYEKFFILIQVHYGKDVHIYQLSYFFLKLTYLPFVESESLPCWPFFFVSSAT